MAMRTSESESTAVKTLSDDEMNAFFDEQARALLGISGEEFLERWNNGGYAGDDTSDVVYLALLAVRGQ